jgi:hypothetical protein
MSTLPIGFSSKDECENENRYVNIRMHRAVGLIAATIFLFGVGARLLPLRPKEEVGNAH